MVPDLRTAVLEEEGMGGEGYKDMYKVHTNE
jgi:hypothetical protein